MEPTVAGPGDGTGGGSGIRGAEWEGSLGRALLGRGTAAGEGGAGEPCETGGDLYFGMITPQSEINALFEAYQICSLSIHPPQGPRAVLCLGVGGHATQCAGF